MIITFLESLEKMVFFISTYSLTLKNKGRSWSCSLTAVEKDLPALAISHFSTSWKQTHGISQAIKLGTIKEWCNANVPDSSLNVRVATVSQIRLIY